jgi:hypothetical protein
MRAALEKSGAAALWNDREEYGMDKYNLIVKPLTVYPVPEAYGWYVRSFDLVGIYWFYVGLDQHFEKLDFNPEEVGVLQEEVDFETLPPIQRALIRIYCSDREAPCNCEQCMLWWAEKFRREVGSGGPSAL